MRWIPTAVLAAILAASAFGSSVASGKGPLAVSVMVDFGTGRIVWADLSMPAGATLWNATMEAATGLGLDLNVTWYNATPFLNDIGEAHPSWPDYWHFLIWNVSRWDFADLGPADLPATNGAVCGWFLSRDAPWNFTEPWPGPRPEATPDASGRHPVEMFRYDLGGSGTAAGAGPVSPHVAWTYDTGAYEITATPAFAHGTVYLSMWTGFVALDEGTGTLRWRNPDVAGASSPALYDGRIYVGGKDGRLHVLSESDGTELWNRSLQPDAQFSGITASPRIAYGRVYVGTFNETGGDGSFVALDLFTHDVVWSRPVSSVHLSSAAIADHVVYVGLMGHFHPSNLTYSPPYGLLALDADSGAQRWFVATNGSVASSPALANDSVFFTTKAGEAFSVGIDGVVHWRHSELVGSIASPAVSDGTLAIGWGVFGTDGAVQTFSLAGDVRWTTSLIGTPVSASPTIAGDRVYAATNDGNGTVYSWRLSALGSGEWALQPGPPDYLLSSPVVHEGALYIASDNGRLYRLADVSASTPSGIGIVPLIIVGGLAAAGLAVLISVWMLGRSRRGP